METRKQQDVILLFNDSFYNVSDEEYNLQLDEVKNKKEKNNDENINISLIAFEELEKMGFEKDISTIVLSKLIETLYYERKEYSEEDYFDLSIPNNKHYTNLVNYYKVGNEQLYRAMIAKAIGNSNCEIKNINEIVYGTVNNISNRLVKKTIKYQA